MSSTGIKRALLIGINYYSTPSVRLNGCIADINSICNMLMDAYGYAETNITMLRDDMPSKMPTKANILAAINAIVSVSGPNDEIWFHYSGHGTQTQTSLGSKPEDNDEALDEAIVPLDYEKNGLITDDQLFAIIKNIRGRAFLAFDSCHSGSICDLKYSMNYAKGTVIKSITTNRVVTNPNIVVLSGCRDEQTSADSYNNFENVYGGAMTMALTTVLRQANHNTSYITMYSKVCYELAANGYTQIPVLSSTTSNPSLYFSRPLLSAVSFSLPSTLSIAGSKPAVYSFSTPTGPKKELAFSKNSSTISSSLAGITELFAKPYWMTTTANSKTNDNPPTRMKMKW